MNDTTPQKALQDVIALFEYPDTPKNGVLIAERCYQLVRQHGQHFAGLEAHIAGLNLEIERVDSMARDYGRRAEAAEAELARSMAVAARFEAAAFDLIRRAWSALDVSEPNLPITDELLAAMRQDQGAGVERD